MLDNASKNNRVQNMFGFNFRWEVKVILSVIRMLTLTDKKVFFHTRVRIYDLLYTTLCFFCFLVLCQNKKTNLVACLTDCVDFGLTSWTH